MHGSVKVKVKYANGTIESVEVLEQYETPELTEKVWSDMPAAMVAANSVEVDTIGGATVSSHALISAVTDAIAQA
jgi:fumarate reductase flavoprotein subunit